MDFSGIRLRGVDGQITEYSWQEIAFANGAWTCMMNQVNKGEGYSCARHEYVNAVCTRAVVYSKDGCTDTNLSSLKSVGNGWKRVTDARY